MLSCDVGDFPGHQELERIYGALIIREIDQALIDDFGPCLGGDIAAEVHV